MPSHEQPKKNLLFGGVDDAFEARLATFDDPAWLTHDDVQKPATTKVEDMQASTRTRPGMRQSRVESIHQLEVERVDRGRYFNLLNPL